MPSPLVPYLPYTAPARFLFPLPLHKPLTSPPLGIPAVKKTFFSPFLLIP